MSIFDAVLDTDINLMHVRQEPAAVYMASAWAALTGKVGVALATGGPGHTNAAAALCTPLASETPMILLSGHASTEDIGRGGFQELPQAEMAVTVSKAAWTVNSVSDLGHSIASAAKIASSGRPGPVHLSLPSNLLDAQVKDNPTLWPNSSDFLPSDMPLGKTMVSAVISALKSAKRPIIVGGPTLCNAQGQYAIKHLGDSLNVPVVTMESPRGLRDPALGAFSQIIRKCDLVILVGKPLDFTLDFGGEPAFNKECNFISLDPDIEIIQRVYNEKRERLILSAVANSRSAVSELAAYAEKCGADTWREEFFAAVNYRPSDWEILSSKAGNPMHALELCRGIRSFMNSNPDSVLICDGGEIGQWAQGTLASKRRLTNGVAGSIGSAVPFGLAACTVERDAPVIAICGDGAFGYHLSELDTAVRYGLPVIIVVGNDACWNAEHQIQISKYGENRMHGCELLPTRYDLVAEALGAYGELVTDPHELSSALGRAHSSGKPACLNVMIEGNAAPAIQQ